MRRNGVIDITIAGNNTRSVSEIAICIGTLSVPPLVAVAPTLERGDLAAVAAQALDPRKGSKRKIRSINVDFRDLEKKQRESFLVNYNRSAKDRPAEFDRLNESNAEN